jgi:outer membrane receptor protein involved in Fe transport
MGLGRNYGIELTIEKFFSNNYYFLVTGSLFESKYKAGDGNWYNTVFNSNYVTNWLVGKDFKTGKNKQNIFGLNFKVFVKGGFRYTPVNWDLSGDDPVYITSQSFTEQAPYMLRFDLGLKYRKNNPKYSWIVSLDIQNLTSRKNILGYEYKRMGRNQWMEPIEGLPLIPILNFRVVF